MFAVSITRLTVLKSLCQEPTIANRFVTYLARKTLEHVEQGKGQAKHLPKEKAVAHRRLMAEAVTAMEHWKDDVDEDSRQHLWDLLRQIEAEQNEYQRIQWGPVRIVHDMDLLTVEYSLHCLLQPHAAGQWAYRTARNYAERYDPNHGTGLIPASSPLVQDIVNFWADYYDFDPLVDPKAVKENTGQAGKRVERSKQATRAVKARKKGRRARFTPLQGQYLAFIHLYRKLHHEGPSEQDMLQYFHVTPPSVHGMVVRLEELGLVSREPGVARSIRVAIPEEEIPVLK